MARKYRDLVIRGETYRDADHAAAVLGVTATTVRAHARAGTLDRCGAGLSGPVPGPVRVRGVDFASPEACARHFGIGVDAVYRRLSEGRPDDIGRPNSRGIYRARPLRVGPVRFRSMAEASRALGFGEGYVSRAFERDSARMKQRILAAAMAYAARHPDRVCRRAA